MSHFDFEHVKFGFHLIVRPPMPMCAMVCTTPDTRARHSGMWHSARPGPVWGGGLQVLYTFTLYTIAVQIPYTVHYITIAFLL